jgi:putative PIN family toxin of toxin-antitoxin system
VTSRQERIPRRRILIDTNVIVSRALLPESVAGRALGKALREGIPIASVDSLLELASVLRRKKFDRVVSYGERMRVWATYRLQVGIFAVSDTVTDCRDPKDNMILALALSGHADLIVTGDKDLLCLHPWRGIAILSPADYLNIGR